MLPDNIMSINTLDSTLLSPDNQLIVKRKVDYELGPIALNDGSRGLMYQNWKAWISDNNTKVYCAPEDDIQNPHLLVTDTDIKEISFTFDQLARPQLVYRNGDLSRLWWYDTSQAAQVTTDFPDITSPLIAMDDKRRTSSATNDILLVYIKNGKLCYRQQRERYQTERILGDVPMNATRIASMGMGSNYRFTITFIRQA